MTETGACQTGEWDANLWHPNKHSQIAQAKSICRNRCSIMDDCLTYAIEKAYVPPGIDMVLAGLTTEQIRRQRSSLGRSPVSGKPGAVTRRRSVGRGRKRRKTEEPLPGAPHLSGWVPRYRRVWISAVIYQVETGEGWRVVWPNGDMKLPNSREVGELLHHLEVKRKMAKRTAQKIPTTAAMMSAAKRVATIPPMI